MPDEATLRQNLPLMAKLVSQDFIQVDVIEGREVPLEFTVENRSEIRWPFKPFVQNERDKSIKQLVDAQLSPGEQTVIRYNFRAPLHQDQQTVQILLQLVEPQQYEKFCSDTIVVICNVQKSATQGVNDSMISGISIVGEDPARHTEFIPATTDLAEEESEQKKQGILDLIDQGLNENRPSAMYDEQSIDDARSMVESIEGNRASAFEEDEIMKTTRNLLDTLRSEQQKDGDEEEKDDVQERMAKLGAMLDRADSIRHAQHSERQ